MKVIKSIIFLVLLSVSSISLALTEVTEGIEWYYTINGDYANTGIVYSFENPGVKISKDIMDNIDEDFIQGVYHYGGGGILVPFILGGRGAVDNRGNYYWRLIALSAVARNVCGEIIIPSTLGGLPVSQVGACSFLGCQNLTDVIIGNNVECIGDFVFAGCGNLATISISNNVKSIGRSAFYGCNGLVRVHISDLSSWCNISFNNDLANPLFYAHNLYLNDSLMVELEIPTDVSRIGDFAFACCSNLTSVVIPDNIKVIGESTFRDCNKLISATMSNNVAIISDSAFSGCSNLTNLKISDNVTSIGDSAFSGCSKLMSITIPGSVTNIGGNAFHDCNGLTNILVNAGCTTYKSVNGLLLSKDGSVLIRGVNGNITIPHGVTRIQSYAFSGCSRLTNLTIPNSVKTIEDAAFIGCTGLTSVTIPDSVTSIGDSSFYGCNGLTSVQIPNNVIRIGNSAFDGCRSLTSVMVPQCICSSGLALSFPDAYQSITNIVISDGVTSIGTYAFENCKNLNDVTIPYSVTNIANNAFHNCSAVANVIVSASNTKYTFENGMLLSKDGEDLILLLIQNGNTEVLIPDSVVSIGPSAFAYCGEIMNVTIADSVTSINGTAFDGCCKLMNMTFDGNAPEIGGTIFSGVASNCCARVRRLSTGWGVPIPGEWHGIAIDYIDQVVKFDANGGEGGTSNVLERGTTILAPSVTRTGYTFTGWSPSVDVTVPRHDVTYTAQWMPIKYNVTFDANGGTGGWSRSLDYDSAIVAPTVSRTGYMFTGWSQSVAATVPLGGATYTAQWEINQYMVAFDANGGEGGMSEKQDYGTTIVAPMVTRTGYTFRGWSSNVAATVPASNVTYTAQWVINRYTVTFDVNGGTCGTDATTIDHGATVGDLPVPARVNATFLGWFTDAEGGEKVDSSLVVTKGMTLYAHWLMLEEALDVGEGIAFANSEGVNWRPVLDSSAKVGDATARSGEIGDRTNTWLSATVSGAGTMSFWCKVSCEHDDDNTFTWDRLMVYTNGVEVAEWRMDGETDWTRREVSFAGGENTVKWVYFKDRSVSEGEDCAWVDGVTWTLADVAVDVGGGKSVLVPMDWIDAHSNIVMAVGGDKSVAMKSTAANGRKVWECYVLGLDPEKTSDFKITSFPLKSDGTPDLSAITFEPEQNRWNLSGATPKLKGKATLDAEWQDVPPGGDPSFRFFTVEVQMP